MSVIVGDGEETRVVAAVSLQVSLVSGRFDLSLRCSWKGRGKNELNYCNVEIWVGRSAGSDGEATF